MSWKTKRLLATAVSFAAIYLVFAFIKMDFAGPLAREVDRFILCIFSFVAAVAAWTYPGWKWVD